MELIWVLVLFFGIVYPSQPSHLEVAYQWKYLDWVWPNIHLTGKNYTLGNSFTQDVDIDRQGRVFVTSPQWLDGVPFSLSLVTKAHGPGGHLLVPYPNWSWHTLSCESIVSVYRVAVISELISKLDWNCGRKILNARYLCVFVHSKFFRYQFDVKFCNNRIDRLARNL